MILAFILVLVALLLLLVVVWFIWRRSRPGHPETLISSLQVLDLEAFRNLLDPEEEDFLRTHLTPRQFRSIERCRLRAVLAYLNAVSGNAAILVRVGQAAIRGADPTLAAAARALVNSALQLRLYAMLSITLMYLRMAAPAARVSAKKVPDRYERLWNLTSQLKILQAPARPA